ncbi:UNKNOWN [Stylonychia lemnae]|uniref:Uncharacterized protein n=1 Tax=Stylonychia lemnae TaxID=5949 RepID=A0A078B2L8_STYLE|nr:UNKNOWN [Stylonychia lemnae]|eukprot:CDW87728.1 UNKNOWN [Stylonychia lemnae]
MKKLLLTVSLLAVIANAAPVNSLIDNQRAQLKWRQEATNKFNWKKTQELKWEVVNAFIDVQTSPDGDVYAIQKLEQELNDPKYYVYLYNAISNTWQIYDKDFQAKAVRFNLLGRMYFLDTKNCVLNEKRQRQACGFKDFEIYADGKIIAIHDGVSNIPVDTLATPYQEDPNSNAQFKALNSKYIGLTLLQNQLILINWDNTIDANYGSEKMVSISAGVDGALWGLLYESNVKQYQIAKWQTITQKWYKIEGQKGVALSAYNEISVAVVDERGLLSLSSQNQLQQQAVYI